MRKRLDHDRIKKENLARNSNYWQFEDKPKTTVLLTSKQVMAKIANQKSDAGKKGALNKQLNNDINHDRLKLRSFD
jgi:hypothetical protein